MSACKFWQTYKHMYTCVHISINILTSFVLAVFCVPMSTRLCACICVHHACIHLCAHNAFVILITANIHIFTISIDSQPLFFYLVFEHVLYFVYSFEGLMED